MSEDKKKLTAEELETAAGGVVIGQGGYCVVKSKTKSCSDFWYDDIMSGVGVNLPNGTKVFTYWTTKYGPGGGEYMHVQETGTNYWGWMLVDDLSPA